MTISKKWLLGIPVVLSVILVILFQLHISVGGLKAAASGFTYYNSGTNTAVLCKNGQPTLISTSTPARVYVRISDSSANTGNLNDMYLGLGTTAATGTGIYLNATSSTWEMGQNELVYAGPIYCLADGQDATATITTIP